LRLNVIIPFLRRSPLFLPHLIENQHEFLAHF
jgi:hypothetical protein